MNSPFEFLTVPGWNGSGPSHWQTHWEAQWPALRRVEQRDWAHPVREAWIAGLDAAVSAATRPVVLIAHSLGCLAVAHWASARGGRQVAGAFLVAPPDLSNAPAQALSSFAPVPKAALPFPAVLVASATDPYIEPAAAEALARDWSAGFVSVGDQGHINADSGHGPWPEGVDLLRRFVETV